MLTNLSNTSGQPNAVVVIQPGLQVQPVVLVDNDGNAVTPLVNPMTTSGDMIYGGTGGTPERLAIGTPGQVLTVSSGTVPSWGSAFTNPMTTPGDIIYESSGTAPTRLAGNTSTQKEFLSSQGGGSAASAPTWSVVPGQYLCAPAVYAPSSQVIFSTASATLSAVSSANISTGSFTAPPSGSVVVVVSVVAQITTTSQGYAYGLLNHGGSTPYGALTIFGDSSAGIRRPYTMPIVVGGLSAGSSYDFDLAYCAGGGGTISTYVYGQSSTAPTLSSAGQGAPVTMTVQSV